MRFACAAVAATTLLAGCAHEHGPWPPPPADVARINDAAREEIGYLRVEYIDPYAHKSETPEMKPIRIEAVDPDTITFRTRAGGTRLVPAELVAGVTVKDRDLGGLVGVGIGLGAAAAELGALWFIDPVGCCNGKTIAVAAGINAFIGLVIGYAVSGRRTFHFDRAR